MVKKILKENYIYMLVILALIVIMAIIMKSPLHEKIMEFDQAVITFIKSIHDDYLTSFFRILTNFGDVYIPLVILLIILLFNNNRWVFILQTCSYGLSGVLVYIFKIIVARPRPIEALINMPKTYSFPSGHTFTSFVFYMILFYLLSYKRTRDEKTIVVVLGAIMAILIAFSRVYLGVHYFSDVIGGFILAIPFVLMIKNIINKNFDKKLLS